MDDACQKRLLASTGNKVSFFLNGTQTSTEYVNMVSGFIHGLPYACKADYIKIWLREHKVKRHNESTCTRKMAKQLLFDAQKWTYSKVDINL